MAVRLGIPNFPRSVHKDEAHLNNIATTRRVFFSQFDPRSLKQREKKNEYGNLTSRAIAIRFSIMPQSFLLT